MINRVGGNLPWLPFATSTPLKQRGEPNLNKNYNNQNEVKTSDDMMAALLDNFQKSKQADLSKQNIGRRRIRNKESVYFEAGQSSSSSSEDENEFSYHKSTLTLKVDSVSLKKIKELEKNKLLVENVGNHKERDKLKDTNNAANILGKLECESNKRPLKTKNSALGKIKLQTLHRKVESKEISESNKLFSYKNTTDGQITECKEKESRTKQKSIETYFVQNKSWSSADCNGPQSGSYVNSKSASSNKDQHLLEPDQIKKDVSLTLTKNEVKNDLSIFNSPYEKLKEKHSIKSKTVMSKVSGKQVKLEKSKTSKVEFRKGICHLSTDKINTSHQLFSDSREQELLNSLDLTADSSSKKDIHVKQEKKESTITNGMESEAKMSQGRECTVSDKEAEREQEVKLENSKENIEAVTKSVSKKKSSSTGKHEKPEPSDSEKLKKPTILTDDKYNIIEEKKPKNIKSKPVCKIPVKKSNKMKEKQNTRKGIMHKGDTGNSGVKVIEQSEHVRQSLENIAVQQDNKNVPKLRKRKIVKEKDTEEGEITKQSTANHQYSKRNKKHTDTVDNPKNSKLPGGTIKSSTNLEQNNKPNGCEKSSALDTQLHNIPDEKQPVRCDVSNHTKQVEKKKMVKTTDSVQNNGKTKMQSCSTAIPGATPLPHPSVTEFRPGCSIAECWTLKNFKCGVLRVKAKCQNSSKTAHDNSYFGGAVIKGEFKMTIGHEEEMNLKVGDMTFVPPLTDWSIKNVTDKESVMYYWCGRFKAH